MQGCKDASMDQGKLVDYDKPEKAVELYLKAVMRLC